MAPYADDQAVVDMPGMYGKYPLVSESGVFSTRAPLLRNTGPPSRLLQVCDVGEKDHELAVQGDVRFVLGHSQRLGALQDECLSVGCCQDAREGRSFLRR